MQLIIAISSNKGLSLKQLAELLGKSGPNLSGKGKALDILEEEEIVRKEWRISKEDKRKSDEPYYLVDSEMKIVLECILKEAIKRNDDKLLDDLLASNFINYFIEKFGVLPFRESIGFINEDVKKRISGVLFRQPAVLREYENRMAEIASDPKHWASDKPDFVNFLHFFESFESVEFYKKVIKKTYSDLYREKAAEKGAKDPDLLKTFLEYDTALSPFTSYPINDPILTLFIRPFERIYDDVYLRNKADYEMMVQRAYFIYSNFNKILVEGIMQVRVEEDYFDLLMKAGVESEEDYLSIKKKEFIKYLRIELFFEKEHLRPLIKELIFYWNIASLRLDWTYFKLKFYASISCEVGRIKYHTLTNFDGIQFIDLESKKNRHHSPDIPREAMMLTSLWSGDVDPFTNLRYCECFKDMGLDEVQTSFEDIVKYVEENLNFMDEK